MCVQGHDVNTPNCSPCYTTSLQKRNKDLSIWCQETSQELYNIMRGSLVKNPLTGSVSSDLFFIKRECTLHPNEAFTSTDSTREAEDAFKSSACHVHTVFPYPHSLKSTTIYPGSTLHCCLAIGADRRMCKGYHKYIYPTECEELEFMRIWALGWEQIHTS